MWPIPTTHPHVFPRWVPAQRAAGEVTVTLRMLTGFFTVHVSSVSSGDCSSTSSSGPLLHREPPLLQQ